MGIEPIRLKVLLQTRHWQTYGTFCREYDRAARDIDSVLVGSYPSRAQLHRWQSGELKGLPYPHHCRVLEEMFPGWTAAQLFETGSVGEPSANTPGPVTATPYTPEVDIFVDMNEEDNRLIAQRIRDAKTIFFAAHTGYAAMVSQYQAATRQAIANGCKLRVVVSNPNGPLLANAELSRRLCPSIRQVGEIIDVLSTCRRHLAQAVGQGLPEENVQAHMYDGPPSMNVLLVDEWLRVIPYLPLVDAAESPVFEFAIEQDNPSSLVAKYLTSIERLWADSAAVDLSADPTVIPQQVGAHPVSQHSAA
jgi:hypothetical protein